MVRNCPSLLVPILILLCSLISHISSGQKSPVDKGAIIISGDLQFSSEGGKIFSQGDGRNYTIAAEPSFIYFPVKGFIAGIETSVGYRLTPSYEQTVLAIGPKIGGAIGDTSSTVFPFLSVQPKYARFNTEFDQSGINTLNEASGLSIGLEIGVLIQAGNHVGIRITAQYEGFSLKADRLNTTNPNEPFIEENAEITGQWLTIGVGLSGLLY